MLTWIEPNTSKVNHSPWFGKDMSLFYCFIWNVRGCTRLLNWSWEWKCSCFVCYLNRQMKLISKTSLILAMWSDSFGGFLLRYYIKSINFLINNYESKTLLVHPTDQAWQKKALYSLTDICVYIGNVSTYIFSFLFFNHNTDDILFNINSISMLTYTNQEMNKKQRKG